MILVHFLAVQKHGVFAKFQRDFLKFILRLAATQFIRSASALRSFVNSIRGHINSFQMKLIAYAVCQTFT